MALDPMRNLSGIERAIATVGGAIALAERLGVTHQAVYQWRIRGWPPLARVKDISLLSKVPTTDLIDPDLLHLTK